MEIAGRIALLDPSVVDQIAAGEVIERPASVVKELLDNALDAGATRISVDAVEGGRGLIRVADDGCGMSGDEALLSLSRHATSKLRVADDLTRIETLGFRGEGLAAVAAVSRLTIETRRDEDSAGWRVSCDGGGKASRAPTARGRGTTVSVRDLFFNTPARLKFLRSKAAETAHITEMCVRIACGFPRVRFTLRHGDRVALELPAAADRLGRARAVVGRHAAELAHARLERGPMAVEICLAAPHAATRTARQLTVLVNGRPVRERRLQQAVANGYGVALRQASFPLGVVYIDVDPREVDVNV
ncbi:MAG: DNA mismatch repair endonuclease MutL, partial [Myxococcales bacterium]|nr:DNA mismatch repair endonuclease MutL [Myxococcales bacterium]